MSTENELPRVHEPDNVVVEDTGSDGLPAMYDQDQCKSYRSLVYIGAPMLGLLILIVIVLCVIIGRVVRKVPRKERYSDDHILTDRQSSSDRQILIKQSGV